MEKELPVAWFDGETFVEEFVDLSFEEGDGWVILDYKTDAVRGDPGRLLARYSPQVRAYRDALRATSVTVRDAGLGFTDTGKVALLASSGNATQSTSGLAVPVRSSWAKPLREPARQFDFRPADLHCGYGVLPSSSAPIGSGKRGTRHSIARVAR